MAANEQHMAGASQIPQQMRKPPSNQLQEIIYQNVVQHTRNEPGPIDSEKGNEWVVSPVQSPVVDDVPITNRISSAAQSPPKTLDDGERLMPRFRGPAIHLVNLIPSSASLATPSVPLVQAILSRANLPIETVALAVCILDSLDSRFARRWRISCPLLSDYFSSSSNKRHTLSPTPFLPQRQQLHIDSVNPELIILAALVIAVKFTEDPQERSQYYCQAWGRDMWSHQQLNVTERCIMEHLNYRIMPLCDEDFLADAMVDMQLASQQPGWDSGSAPNVDLIAKTQETDNEEESVKPLTTTTPNEDDERSRYSAATSIMPSFAQQPQLDSGYGSAPNVNLIAKTQETDNKEESVKPLATTTPNEDDERTVYSAATSIMPSFAQQSISEVCEDIYTRIGNHMSDKSWASMSNTLPDLIKAFAIKLGTSTSGDLNRRIMYFVHKHHQEIIQQLELMLQHAHDDSSEVRPKASDAMSLNDKMSLWGKNWDDENREVDRSDLFQGVEEDDDDNIWHPELLAYKEAIFSSPAYAWLIGSLLKQSTFHWDDTQPRTMIDAVREPILAKLPKGTISKRRDPITYGVTFWLPWSPLSLRIREERDKQLATLTPPISEFVVLTSSSLDQIQATTVKQYFEQTWAFRGMDLLNAIQMVVDALHGDIASATQLDKTEIRATISGPALVVHAVGSAHSIAECGEQLTWLGAALQPSQPGHVVYSTPSLTAIPTVPLGNTVENLAEYFAPWHSDLYQPENMMPSREFWEGLPCHQHWAIGHENQAQDGPLILRLHLGGRLAQPVIVRGFPTRRRPQPFSGIEVSTEMLFSLVRTASLKVDVGRLSLQESGYMLRVVKRADEVIVWHITRSPNLVCTCKLHPLWEHDVETLRDIDLNNLSPYRHILEHCMSTGSSVPNDASDLTSTSAEAARHASIDPLEHSTSQSTMAVESQDTPIDSIDSDMLSISDDSEGTSIEPWSPGTELALVIHSVVHRLVWGYRRTTTIIASTPDVNLLQTAVLADAPAENDVPNNSGRGLGPMPNASSTTTQCNNRLPQKRGRGGDDDDDEAGGGSPNLPSSKKPKPEQGQGSSRSFACPFWKHDHVKHRKCFGSKLFMIKRVKQHIARKHTPAFYCDRCLVVFSDLESHQSHVRNEPPCKCEAPTKLDGISHYQQWQLSRKSDRNHSETEKWFAIWDIVFPDQPRPASAYMDSNLSEDLCGFQEFSQRHGATILLQRLRASGISSLSDEEMTLSLQEVLRQGLNQLHEEWLTIYASYARSTASNPRSTQPMQYQTPGNSLADSGVAFGSQTQSSELRFTSSLGLSSRPSTQHDLFNQALQDSSMPEDTTTLADYTLDNSQYQLDENDAQPIGNDATNGDRGHFDLSTFVLDSSRWDFSGWDQATLENIIEDRDKVV